jgi:hypothetical protein
LTLEEINYFWEIGFKYDHERRGFKFEKKITPEAAKEKRDALLALYGE